MTLGWFLPNIFGFWSTSSSEYFLKISPFWPLSGGGAIYDPRKFICTNLNLHVPRLLHTKYQCIRAIGLWEEYFSDSIPKISPIVSSFWDPKGTSLLICAHFSLHSPMMLPTKFDSNQFKMYFPRKAYVKRNNPSGAILGRILFLCASFTNHVPRMLYVKYQSIWTASSWEEDFLKFTKFYAFLPLIGPQ